MLHRGELQVSQKIAVPEERQKESRYTDTVHIEVADLHAPPGVTTTLVDGRNRIPVTLHRLVDRHLSVRFDYTADERLGPVKFEPVKVVVRGPQEILDRMRTMPTQPFVIPAPPEGIPPAQPITLTPVSLVRELEGLPVRDPCGSRAAFHLAAAAKTLRNGHARALFVSGQLAAAAKVCQRRPRRHGQDNYLGTARGGAGNSRRLYRSDQAGIQSGEKIRAGPGTITQGLSYDRDFAARAEFRTGADRPSRQGPGNRTSKLNT